MLLNSNYKKRIQTYISKVILTLFILFPQVISGQEYDVESEMEKGIAYFNNAQFNEAFTKFEKISEVLSQSEDQELLPIIYYNCQHCKYLSGDIRGSISYGEKAINLRPLPPDYQIYVLSTLLKAYDELGFKDKCVSTIAKLDLLWKSFKVTDILETLVVYYYIHQDHSKVISFENELQYLTNIDTPNDLDKITYTVHLNTIYMCMSGSFSELKNYNKSISYLEKCLETLTPYTQENKSAIYLDMADQYNKLGDKKSALKYQKLAIETE